MTDLRPARDPARVVAWGVALRLAVRKLRRRLSGTRMRAPDLMGFRRYFETMLKRLPPGTLVDARLVEIPASRRPWTQTGLRLDPGDRITTFARGRTYLSRALDLWVAPPFQLWLRIGAGPVFRGTRASHSMVVTGAIGDLALASHWPGEWAAPDGSLATDPAAYAGVDGTMLVAVLVWGVPIEDGLKSLLALGDYRGLVAGELDRQAHGRVPPPGWTLLWSFGDSESFFRDDVPGRERAIACRSLRDAAVLLYDLDAEMVPGLRLEWSWKVDRLPTDLREDTPFSHDHLSIAIECDNGQRLAYYWSAALPVGTAYRCPLPHGKTQQTHVVLRSGAAGLGHWHGESRDLHADYRAVVGGASPARVKRVWLIAHTLFARGEGLATFADIALVSSEGRRPLG